MKKKLPKLSLRREVVRRLNDDQARLAAGGTYTYPTDVDCSADSGYCTWETNGCQGSDGFFCGYGR